MKSFSILLLSAMFSFNVTAATCSTKQLAVCAQPADINSNPVDQCVTNTAIKSYFANNPSSTVGTCAQFDLKKIQSYACNAGLRFVKPAGQVCIKRDQDNAIATSCGDSLNCECSSTDSASSLKANYFNFGIADYTGATPAAFVSKTMNASNTATYAVASAKPGSQILQDGSGLQFAFGSDLYGAEYFVDLCILNKNQNPSRFDLNLTGRILFANSIFNKTNYNTASSLYNKIEINCVDGDGTTASKILSTDSPFTTAEKKYSRTITGSKTCVVRNYFKENAQNRIRENNYKKITFQTDLTIAPADESLLVSAPVKLCKVKTVSKDKYSCTAWTSTNAEVFVRDIQTSSFIDADTYVGACSNPCKPL